MATKTYKYGRAKGAAKAIVADLPGGKEQAFGIMNLHVLIVPDGKGWFAQAFEIDYGVQGKSLEEVKARFEKGLAATVRNNLDIFGEIDNMLRPNQDWYTLKAQIKGSEYDYSCIEMCDVAPKFADRFNLIKYEAVRPVAA
jgi:hypothetical protein